MAGKACWTLMCYIKVYYVELRQARRVVLSDVELNCVAVWFSRLGKLYCAESRRDEVWQSRRVGLRCVLLSSGRLVMSRSDSFR